MSLLKFLLPAAALAGTALAECSAQATATIQNSGDASAIATCTTFKGSIAVETGVADPIELGSIRKIDGDFVVRNNSALTSIKADSLEEISGTFELDTVQVLNTLSFPKLSTVQGIKWNALPNLQSLDFSSEITKADVVDIQNTQLGSLKGINLESIKKLYIANNRYISDISMKLANVGESLTLEANNPEVNVSFPEMTWAYNLTFRNCSSVDLPSLETLNGSMGFYGNVFEGFAAPNLTEIGGALSFVSNTEATNISLPELTEVKANLQIANNTKLSKINDIGKLKTIGGALDFNGNFTELSLPALNDVKGAFNVQSTGDVQGACDDFFKPLSEKKKIQGKFVCEGKVDNPGGQGTTPSKSGGDDKKGAAPALDVRSNAAMGLVALVAAFFF